MKKYYIALGILGLLIGYFSKIDFWFEDAREVFFPITKQQLKLKKNTSTSRTQTPADEASVPAEIAIPNTLSATIVDLETLSQYELFHELYNSKVLKQTVNQAAYFEKIKERLNLKYPVVAATEHKNAYEKEVANRLGLLKAMSQFWPTPKEVRYDHKRIKQFFYDVAKNQDENIMVRRQAYKNWLTFGNSASQSEKSRFLASADERLLHLVSLSDENLIQSLTEGAE